MKTLSILLADDHEVVRRGLRAVLAERPDWAVCGEASTGRQAVKLAREFGPDVVVMDLTMPELNGLEATRQIREALPDTEVLILTMHAGEELVREVLAAGAHGFVLKSDAGKSLIAAIEALARREPFFTSRVAEAALRDCLPPGASARASESSALTPREREVVQLVE